MTPPRLLAPVVLVLLLTLGSSASAGVMTDPALETEVIVTGLVSPTAMAFYGDGDFLVLEKNSGRVRNVVNYVLQADALVLQVQGGNDERGLLGIVVHPSFAQNQWVYLFFTPSSAPNSNRVVRYRLNGGSLTDATNILTLDGAPASVIHQGGSMAFGPDGKLFIVVGDRGQNGGLQNGTGATVADDTSVIFRLNEGGSAAGGNPLSGTGLSKYFAYGIRNSFGIAFDPQTGALWDTENGPENYDELNRVDPGFNSGWLPLMGPDARDSNSPADLTSITGGLYSDPEFSWFSSRAPTGLLFLHGSALGTAYDDTLLVGHFGFAGSEISQFQLNASRTAIVPPHPTLSDLVADPGDNVSGLAFGTDFGAVTDLKLGHDGRLYGVSYGRGEVFVIRRVGDVPPPPGNVRDLAVIGLKAPKRVKLSAKHPERVGKVKVSIQNRGPETETISSPAVLEELVTLDVESIVGDCPSPAVELVPPKKFPITLKSKKKLNVKFEVTFDCANDPEKTSKKSPDHDDFGFEAALHREVLDDQADTHLVDDMCPRPPLAGGVDPNPNGKIKDYGCGGKIAKKNLGAPVVTDVTEK